MVDILCHRAMLGNPQPSTGAVRDVNSNAPEVENYEVLKSCAVIKYNYSMPVDLENLLQNFKRFFLTWITFNM